MSAGASSSFLLKDYSDDFLKKLEIIWRSQKLYDVTLETDDGTRISAHRVILCAASEYFEAMFTSGLAESQQAAVTISDVTGADLQTLIEFCYTGSIALQLDTVETLLHAATMLQLEAAAKSCCQFLTEQLDPNNAVGIAAYADRYNCTELLQTADAYICKHFIQVCNNDEFLQLDAERIEKLFSYHDLNVPSEEDVFNSLLLWMKHDPTNRKSHFFKILPVVRLPLLHQKFIEANVEPLCTTEQSKQLLIDALLCQNFDSEKRRTRAHPNWLTPRNREAGLLLALGYNRNGIINICKYCPHTYKWTDVGKLYERRDFFGSVLFQNKLFILGGYCNSNRETFNKVISLDMKTLIVTKHRPMKYYRYAMGVAVLHERLYVIGGRDYKEQLKYVERYDPYTDTWEQVPDVPTKRSGVRSAVLGDSLYAVGGFDGLQFLKSVVCFDPTTRKWAARAPMRVARASFGITAHNGCLYVAGGVIGDIRNLNCSAQIECYDPRWNIWTVFCTLSIPRYNTGCVFLGDVLTVVGGFNRNQEPVKTVEEWNHKISKLFKKTSPETDCNRFAHCFHINFNT